MKILITGASGMIGSYLSAALKDAGFTVLGVDIKEKEDVCFCDLGDKAAFEKIVRENDVNRIIHLAALAHTMGGKKYPDDMYRHLNVECANNVFEIAASSKIPVLFISTVDVFGFQKGIVNAETECHPVTIYGKTKLEAENKLKSSGAAFTIFRFSPVYTENIKRDIQKRIYLKYPNWAYQVGKNTQYEVLNIDKAVGEMVKWCNEEPQQNIKIIKDIAPLNTVDYINEEKAMGNAKHVIRLPRWIVICGYSILRITGKNKYTFLINKAVNPLRSE